MNISLILETNYPGSEWTLNGEEYSGLTWLSNTSKPSKEALENQWAEVEYVTAYEAVSAARLVAYQKDSDPVFFQWQRGEKTEQEWRDAVTAVNEANPYPEKPAGVA